MSKDYNSDSDDVISVDSNFNLCDSSTQTDFTDHSQKQRRLLQNVDTIHFNIDPVHKKNHNKKRQDLKIISNVNGNDLNQPFTLIVKNDNVVIDIDISNNQGNIKVMKDDNVERIIHINEVTLIDKFAKYVEYVDNQFDHLCHKLYSCFNDYRQVEHYELREIARDPYDVV